MGGMLDWSEDSGKSRAPSMTTGHGGGRRTVIIIVCGACHSTEVQQRQIIGSVAYWECSLCGHRWKEDRGIGAAKATIA